MTIYDEFTFRLNQGNVARHTTERLDSFVDAIRGKRLTFSRLTARERKASAVQARFGMNLKSVYEAIGGNVEMMQRTKLGADTSATVAGPLSILNRTVDTVLKYRPKPKTKAAKRRIRRNKRLSKRRWN